jgi:hypothetical protein
MRTSALRIEFLCWKEKSSFSAGKKKGDGDLPSPFPLAHTLPQVLAEN